jgi:diadenosine tetraphosphate (Ap4A) HIT family hydrolase/mRNA-degrading endonuclease RelE of RelBE toxin-antitoxin system
LTGEEQKAAKTTAFDLQLNPTNPGMSFHKLDKARDKNFWSVRIGSDLRMIVHKTDSSLLLCYVGHHDPAYRWAERRKLEVHPRTGAAQWVEIRERVEEVTVTRSVPSAQVASSRTPLFSHLKDDVLLGYGVPEAWLNEVRSATEDSILELAVHLPGEASEALLDLATGTTPQVAPPVAAGADTTIQSALKNPGRFAGDDAEDAWRKSDVVLAFLDVGPVSRGHTLVIPKEAASTLDQLSDEAAAALGRVLPRLCRAVRKATGANSYNVLQNNGAAAHQAVFHVHFHIIPKHEDSGLEIGWPARKLDPAEGAALAQAISSAL